MDILLRQDWIHSRGKFIILGALSSTYKPRSHEAYTLGEAQWVEVLENCGAMYGWCINGPMKQIVRAPKAGKSYLSSMAGHHIKLLQPFNSRRSNHQRVL